MKEIGTRPSGLEVGNAWQLRDPQKPMTNWIVGEFSTIDAESLRFMQQGDTTQNKTGARATDIAIKWFVHQPDDPPAWGAVKPTSEGRTMSILAGDGEFELSFQTDGDHYTLTLNIPGDFAIWGPDLAHSWRPLKTSTVLTVRWKPE
jgi:hypothetical protein